MSKKKGKETKVSKFLYEEIEEQVKRIQGKKEEER